MATAKSKPTASEVRSAIARVVKAIDAHGLLLEHDAHLPCATQLIAGSSISGTWWAHARGQLIYDALSAIDDDLAHPKLVAGKVTLLHRRLWPALIAVGRSASAWQLEGLKPDARALLTAVEGERGLRSDRLQLGTGSRKAGTVVSELERRLLVYSEGQHTEGGHHARVLFSFAAWQRKQGIRDRELPSLEDALSALHDAAASCLGEARLGGLLPWETRPSAKARPKARPGVKSRSR